MPIPIAAQVLRPTRARLPPAATCTRFPLGTFWFCWGGANTNPDDNSPRSVGWRNARAQMPTTSGASVPLSRQAFRRRPSFSLSATPPKRDQLPQGFDPTPTKPALFPPEAREIVNRINPCNQDQPAARGMQVSLQPRRTHARTHCRLLLPCSPPAEAWPTHTTALRTAPSTKSAPDIPAPPDDAGQGKKKAIDARTETPASPGTCGTACRIPVDGPVDGSPPRVTPLPRPPDLGPGPLLVFTRLLDGAPSRRPAGASPPALTLRKILASVPLTPVHTGSAPAPSPMVEGDSGIAAAPRVKLAVVRSACQAFTYTTLTRRL
ncbi:hypothetical protein PCL_07843 [Purpureocillium lilacinum]|uniref:Uncharacterized protein n=1 Tax=Purpureocillium lilacinum TaxID=33203 RepID=A0A2U3EJ50_PURLI|nr:hypothetical protein PCL_07843 [Purpureocillium lilacinum]